MSSKEPDPATSAEPEWVSPITAESEAAMRADGRCMVRLLHQMRCPLPVPAHTRDATTPIRTRPFDPDRDPEAWLEVNNRAFRWHPDQGGWDRARLDSRLAEPWVHIEGFLVHDGADGSVDGFCWTREHPGSVDGSVPAMGEIFVIAADPSTVGTGLGRSLTVAGLDHLAARGLRLGMLYVEATNTPAVRLYERLGFVVDHSDAAFRR